MFVQDGNEIYLIISQYNMEYVKYLHGKWKQGDKLSFLTMRDIGPFKPKHPGHMRRIGQIMLALTLQLVQNAEKGYPYRW